MGYPQTFEQYMRSLQQKIYGTNKANGFWPEPSTDRNFGEALSLVHSEVSEALEAWRKHGFKEWREPDGKLEGVCSELADTVIRILDIVEGYGLGDLLPRIEEKLDYNAKRGFRHGGKLA